MVLFQFDQQVFCVDLPARLDVDGFDHGVAFGVDACFHFHGLDGEEHIAFLDRLADD